MGGMLTQIMLAKYPDLFAAGVAGQGISDLTALQTVASVAKAVSDECGDPAKNRFEYQRRSSINYASNFAYAPLIMWHGTNDIFVQPEQSETLHNAIKKHNRFQEPVHWLNAGYSFAFLHLSRSL
jgi:dipeptidyl aminopeptidase/acylaminoacyl peptidase